ncbi:MAG: hypothetical protein R3225_08175, partial [Halofilum sp. (in: g-proteobacteria)]|nr:hypothetical protein [Halofilum sp. (in: g-proteobacteria)]
MKELIFSGSLRPGADRRKVVAALARRFKRSPAEIEQRLFGGRPVRLARCETRGEAVRRAAELARLGLIVEIRDAGTATAAPAGTPAPARGGAGWRRRRLGLGLGLATLVVVVAAAAWYTAPGWRGGDRSAAEIAAARGLATGDLLLLGHLDVRRLAMLERRFLGTPDPGALLGDQDGLWASLQAHGLEPRAQLDDILVAGYAGSDGLDLAAILLGRFEPARLRAWFESRYAVEAWFESSSTLHFRRQVDAGCAPGTLFAARLGAEQVVVAPAGRLDELGRRILGASRPAIELGRWDRLTSEQVTTLAVFPGERLEQAASGLAGTVLTAAARANEPAEAFYAGLAPVLLPPGVRLQAELVSRDRAYLEQAVARARQHLEAGAARAARGWPELVPLYERAGLEHDGDTLRASVRLDTDFDDELA